jgi:translocation and assembly module TamB
LKVSSPQVAGDVLLNGTASVDAQNNYQVNGALNTHAVSLRSGTTSINNVTLSSPFHADPYLVSLDGLKLSALGGSLAAKVFVEKMQQLSVEGRLSNFSLPVLTAILTGNQIGYDGTIDGRLTATGDLNAKGTTGYRARANLTIVPGARGTPVRGQINAAFVGATGAIRVDPSYIALPNSRLDISGAINRRLDLNLVSQNLNDFLPAANFGAKTPLTALPLALQGGTASLQGQVTGNLSAPQIAGHLSVTSFAVKQAVFDSLALDLSASQSGAAVRNGVLARNTLRTAFDASLGLRKWAPLPNSPVNAHLTLRNATVTQLLSLAGSSNVPATGDVTADVHVNGTYGNPLGAATVQVLNGTAYDQPFNHLSAQVNLADQLITLAPLELDSAAGKIDVTARFQHPRESFTTGTAQVHVTTSNVQLGNLKPLQTKSPGAAGAIQLTADAAATVRESNQQTSVDISNISADLSARGLQVQHQSAGDLTATARTANGAVTYDIVSDFAGSDVKVNGRTTLAANYPTSASASIQNLSIAKVLSLTGQTQIPATGKFSAQGRFAGTMAAPSGDLTFQLADANVYEEPIDRFTGSVHYANTLLDIPAIQLDTPAGSLTLVGSLTHPANDFASGALKLNLKSTDIQLGGIEHIHQQQPTMAGVVHLGANLSAAIREQNGKRILLISSLDADASAHALRMNNKNLGQADFTAKTSGSTLNFQLDSNIAQSKIHGAGHSQLTGDYPTQANLSFTNIKYTNIEPFIPSDTGMAPSFEAQVDGEASLNGPALDPDALTGRLQLNQLSAETHPTVTPTGAPPSRSVKIQNQGPIVIALNKSVVSVQQFHLAGLGTVVNASGAINLKDDTAPIDLKLDSNVDLGMLQDLDRGFYSKGGVSMNAAVHGSFAQPLINGRIELKNANVNYATAPNGLSNANGVILLTGTGATIQNLTGESGGGKITVTGFAGLTGRSLSYNLKANASKVRVRYSGISVTTTANIELVGSTRRSVLSGNVTVQRIAYNSSSDAGSLLSSFAAKPPSAPSAPSGLLTGMRLNIHILTSPDLRVSTTYADRLSVEANLTVRGTAVDPGMLGRLVVTEGKLVFFGNTYTVNTGTVNFYNPTSIEPIVNISLETLAQGVDVTLGVSGPMDNLQLNYRSDPPLNFEQIVQLLATNTTPNDPNIVANQPPAPQQSFTQMGESAVLGQAVANPLASRVQRVFGLNQFKIDPSVAGVTGQPTARVTLQQKIFNNVTFTYITDITQTNSQIVRVQWDLTPKLSAIGLRDYNGNVSIEFGYKFTVR